MKISFAAPRMPRSGTVVVAVMEDRKLSPHAAQLDKDSGGALKRAIEASRFTGKSDETLAVLAPPNLDVKRVLLIGVGKPRAGDRLARQNRGGIILAALNAAGEQNAAFFVNAFKGREAAIAAADLAYGAKLRSYRFDKYRTKEKPEQKPTLNELTFLVDCAESGGARIRAARQDRRRRVLHPRSRLRAGQHDLSRDLGAGSEEARERSASRSRCSTRSKMKKLGMGALLGVGQGSVAAGAARRHAVERATASAKNKAPVAFVGKGVTFDTGGISIKPAAGMEDMKWDMGGAGVVDRPDEGAGRPQGEGQRRRRRRLRREHARRQRAAPGRHRQVDVGPDRSRCSTPTPRAGSCSPTRCGTARTASSRRLMVDLATLTGAIIIALGHENAGLFSNNDAAGRASDRRRQGSRRAAVADAAGRCL